MLETERDRAILTKFLIRSIVSLLATFRKIHFPATFCGLLEFLCYLNCCVKRKNVFTSEMEQDRPISMKFWTHRVSAGLLATFRKNCFPATFGGHLEIRRKTKTCLSRKQSEIERFQQSFDLQGICRVYWCFFARIVFPPFLAAILNFCIKHKNLFISEME